VEDGLIAGTVLPRTVDDSWLFHKLLCYAKDCKITCDLARLIQGNSTPGLRFDGFEDHGVR
jgi:hypothetical protein